MAGRPVVRRLTRVVLFLLGIALAGCLSSVLSRRSAEQASANRVAGELATRDIFVLADDDGLQGDGARSAEVLARAGFAVRDCVRGSGEFACFPWASVGRGRVVGPFVVEVQWAVAEAGLSGHGTRTHYLAFFGFVVFLRDVGGFVS